MPLISVIIPTLNAANTLGLALDSLKQQSCQDFEIIIQDNCSKDETLKIVEQYKDFFRERLQLSSEVDSGIYSAMNKATHIARGQWFLFLGADDSIADTEVFQIVCCELMKDRPQLFYGQIRFKDTDVLYGTETSLDNLLFEENIPHQAIFYHNTLFEKLGRFNTRYPIWADWEFNIRCFRIPDLRARYFPITISVFDNKNGVSSQYLDPVFQKESPIFIPIPLRHEVELLKHSQAYRWGSRLVKMKEWLRGKFR